MREPFKVQEGMWDAGAVPKTIQKLRHTVWWTEENDESSITFCNFCGTSFILENENGKEFCAGCGQEQE